MTMTLYYTQKVFFHLEKTTYHMLGSDEKTNPLNFTDIATMTNHCLLP